MPGQVNGSWISSRRAIVRANLAAIKKKPSLLRVRPRKTDRYIVTSISGYGIDPSASHYLVAGDGPGKSTEWYILDTCDAYRIVGTFNRRNAEQIAKRTAARLNDDEREWEKRPW
jgi:hypothetical protein